VGIGKSPASRAALILFSWGWRDWRRSGEKNLAR